MIAEVVTTLGLALEALTSVYPSQFLLLACSGTFAKAVGKGIGKPAFRVIQTHFAVANNVGAVAAKEEVWEVVGQLTGYACSLVMLHVLEETGAQASTTWGYLVSEVSRRGLTHSSLLPFLSLPSLSLSLCHGGWLVPHSRLLTYMRPWSAGMQTDTTLSTLPPTAGSQA